MSADRRCRICGCTGHMWRRARERRLPRVWVAPDLCSTCAPLAAIEAELTNLPADVAYCLDCLDRACGEFRQRLGRGR
jgi:hypothetical protein